MSKLREDLREGISLRDHFAGLAMQKIIDSYDSPVTERSIAKEAYGYADAMIAERNKHHKERHETFGEEV